ncbi:hypothetical protein OBK28_12920, partial [Empedobacter falsenii]
SYFRWKKCPFSVRFHKKEELKQRILYEKETTGHHVQVDGKFLIFIIHIAIKSSNFNMQLLMMLYELLCLKYMKSAIN